MNKIYVTEEGYAQYIAAREELKLQLTELLKTRGAYGINTSENYKTGNFDEERYRLLGAIAEAEETIKRLEIVKKEHSTDGRIGLGDIVTVHFVGTDKMMRVQLSGEMPSVLAQDDLVKITRQSPMGSAIFGKKVGDTVSYVVGDKSNRRMGQQTLTLKILSKENEEVKESDKPKQPGEDEA